MKHQQREAAWQKLKQSQDPLAKYSGLPEMSRDVEALIKAAFFAGHSDGASDVAATLTDILKGCSDLQCIFFRKAQGTNGGCVCRRRLEELIK